MISKSFGSLIYCFICSAFIVNLHVKFVLRRVVEVTPLRTKIPVAALALQDVRHSLRIQPALDPHVVGFTKRGINQVPFGKKRFEPFQLQSLLRGTCSR
jgi:hypothetical protein